MSRLQSTPSPWGQLAPNAIRAGYLGLIPFAGALVALLSTDDATVRGLAERLALGWGAAILSFVAAVHWGLALAGRWPWSIGVIVGSVLPSVLGAAAVIVAGSRGIALLVVGFGLFWLFEHRQRALDLPADYLALRRNLSLSVCVLLALTAIALDGGATA